MPKVEQTLASYLSPDTALSLKALTLPTTPCRTTSASVGKAYTAVRVCTLWPSYRPQREERTVPGHRFICQHTVRHLGLNLSGIKEKDKAFLLDPLLSSPGTQVSGTPSSGSNPSNIRGPLRTGSSREKWFKPSSYDDHFFSVPLGDRSANPATLGASGRRGFQQVQFSVSTLRGCATETCPLQGGF